MWYDKFTFFNKQEGLTKDPPEDYFIKPYTEEEFSLFPDIDSLYPSGKSPDRFPIPIQIKLPNISLSNY